MESRTRQLAELDALRAMYPEEGALTMDASPSSDLAGLNTDRSASHPVDSLNFSGTVFLPDVSLRRKTVGLRFQLPTGYPDQPPDVHVICEAGNPPCQM